MKACIKQTCKMKKNLKIIFVELLRLKKKNTLELLINLLSYKYLKVGQVNYNTFLT